MINMLYFLMSILLEFVFIFVMNFSLINNVSKHCLYLWDHYNIHIRRCLTCFLTSLTRCSKSCKVLIFKLQWVCSKIIHKLILLFKKKKTHVTQAPVIMESVRRKKRMERNILNAIVTMGGREDIATRRVMHHLHILYIYSSCSTDYMAWWP